MIAKANPNPVTIKPATVVTMELKILSKLMMMNYINYSACSHVT
jgi:hypothetical protein